MCGRYTAWAIARGMVSDLQFDAYDEVTTRQRYNAAPGQELPVGLADGVRCLMWGMPNPYGSRPLINAKLENLLGGFWRRQLARRCIVPANGYFEWDKHRQPWLITDRAHEVVYFAGLFDGEGRFVVITQPAAEEIKTLHDRMPVLLEPETVPSWLDTAVDPQQAVALLAPVPPGRLQMCKVSKGVGNVRNDGPELIEPITALF